MQIKKSKKKNLNRSDNRILTKLCGGDFNLLDDVSYVELRVDISSIFIHMDDGTKIHDCYNSYEESYHAFYNLFRNHGEKFLLFSEDFLFKINKIKNVVWIKNDSSYEIVLLFKHTKIICESEFFLGKSVMMHRYEALERIIKRKTP